MGVCGCDVGQGDDQPVDAPPVHLRELLVTTSLDAGNQPQREPAAAGAITNVLATTSLVLRFDRFLLPGDAALRQSVCLQPKLAAVNALADCTNPVALRPTYDPVWREVTFRQDAGARLSEDTVYQLTLLSPSEEQPFGFRAFDGVPLAEALVFQFQPVATMASDEVPSAEDLFCTGSAACLAPCGTDPDPLGCQTSCALIDRLATCSYSTCHAPTSNAQGMFTLGPAMGLDMSTPGYILATAIGQTAHGTQSGEHAQDGDDTPARFGRAMPIIDPGNAGNSYILYKLLAGPAYAQSAAAPPDPKEIERLRTAIVVGMPMPPTNALPRSVIPVQGLADLSTWISVGAPMPACGF